MASGPRPGVRAVAPRGELSPGLEGRAELVVAPADTAAAVGSGDVPVLATPRVVALCEAATVAALAGRLGGERTSVGSRVVLDHRRASSVGARVTAVARLAAVSGRQLGFDVTVTSGDEVVAEGTVDRVVVDRERFLRTAG